jgi:hypothetical protein
MSRISTSRQTAWRGAGALEPADIGDNLHFPAAERKICELTLVAGVNPRRAPAASEACRVARLGPDPERHQVPAQLDAVHYSCSELRQSAFNDIVQ